VKRSSSLTFTIAETSSYTMTYSHTVPFCDTTRSPQHLKEHWPPMHMGVEYIGDGQALPIVPQFEASLEVSIVGGNTIEVSDDDAVTDDCESDSLMGKSDGVGVGIGLEP